MPGAVVLEEGNYKVFNQFENKEFLDYFRIYNKYYNAGYLQGDAAQVHDNSSAMIAGRVAVGRAQYQPCADILWSISYGYKVVSVPQMKPIITNSSVEGAMIAISVNAERPDIDMKFLNLLNTDKYLRNLIQFGIEGVHYEKTAPNRIKYLKGHSNYDMPGFTPGNLFLTYLLPGDPDDKWEVFKKWNESALTSQILGFHFDPDPVTSELAAITNACKEFGPGLFAGELNPDEYVPKFMKALKASGIDNFLAEQQRQLNRWHKTVKAKAKKSRRFRQIRNNHLRLV